MIARESNSVRPSTRATGTLRIGDTSRSCAIPPSVAVSMRSIASPTSAATTRTRRTNGDVVVP